MLVLLRSLSRPSRFVLLALSLLLFWAIMRMPQSIVLILIRLLPLVLRFFLRPLLLRIRVLRLLSLLLSSSMVVRILLRFLSSCPLVTVPRLLVVRVLLMLRSIRVFLLLLFVAVFGRLSLFRLLMVILLRLNRPFVRLRMLLRRLVVRPSLSLRKGVRFRFCFPLSKVVWKCVVLAMSKN